MTMKKDSALVLVRDALETYGDDYMHGIPKRHYLAVIDHALADEPKLVGLTIEDEYVRNYLWERGLIAVDEDPKLREEKNT